MSNNTDLIRDPFDPTSDMNQADLDSHIIEMSELASLIVATAAAGYWDWAASDPLIEAMNDGQLLNQWRQFYCSRVFPLPGEVFECAVRLAARITIRES